MNGRVMPFAGTRLQIDADVDDRLQPEVGEQAGRREQGEAVGDQLGPIQAAQQDEGEQAEQRQAGDQAVLLGDHREHEVAVGVRQRVFDRALARAAAEPGRPLDRVERESDLEMIAGVRIEEAVEAGADVRKEQISLPQAEAAARSAADHQEPGQARRGTAGARPGRRPSAPC